MWFITNGVCIMYMGLDTQQNIVKRLNGLKGRLSGFCVLCPFVSFTLYRAGLSQSVLETLTPFTLYKTGKSQSVNLTLSKKYLSSVKYQNYLVSSQSEIIF